MSVGEVRSLLQRLLNDDAFRIDVRANPLLLETFNLTEAEERGVAYLHLLVMAGDDVVQDTLPQILAALGGSADFLTLVKSHAGRHNLAIAALNNIDADDDERDIAVVIDGDVMGLDLEDEEAEEAWDDWDDDYGDLEAGLPGEPPPIGPDD